MPYISLKRDHFVIVPLKTANRWCALPYNNHPKGCPNPRCKFATSKKYLANEFFDFNTPMFIVWSSFNLERHALQMKKKHPNWTNRQCRNLLYWQKTVDNNVFKIIRKVIEEHKLKGYRMVGEGFGINVYATCRNAGLKLEHIRNPIRIVRKLSLLMKPKSNKVVKYYTKHLGG
uniref:Uncharacterized protein n=1 Tax=viral metagenome TaxID=1070528 RepID=A0A6M3JQ61_9ZZZZ